MWFSDWTPWAGITKILGSTLIIMSYTPDHRVRCVWWPVCLPSMTWVADRGVEQLVRTLVNFDIDWVTNYSYKSTYRLRLYGHLRFKNIFSRLLIITNMSAYKQMLKTLWRAQSKWNLYRGNTFGSPDTKR